MLQKFDVANVTRVSSDCPPMQARCPYCRTVGVLASVGTQDVEHFQTPVFFAGLRRCPNPDCSALLFFLKRNDSDNALHLLPPEVIDFDSSNLPAAVQECLLEAVTCHASNCYRAAAVMVRRTLDEVCTDRKVTGDTLQKRLNALAASVALPSDLVEGLEELKLLGNDGAHVFTKHYESADEELRLALDLVKQILLSVYQHASLVSRLRARRRDQQASSDGAIEGS